MDRISARAQIITLSEIIKKKDSLWQDYVLAIQAFHVGHTSIAQTAKELCLPETHVKIALQVARALHDADPKIKACSTMNAAYDNIIRRRRKRTIEKQLELFEEFVEETFPR